MIGKARLLLITCTSPLQRSDSRFQQKNSYNKYATIISIHTYNEIEFYIIKNYTWDVPLKGYFYISFIYVIDIRVFTAQAFKREIY